MGLINYLVSWDVNMLKNDLWVNAKIEPKVTESRLTSRDKIEEIWLV